MSGELVLITGVSGLIGHAVLREALNTGYRARAVIRKKTDIEKVKTAFAANPELLSKIEFSEIPDLAAPNAFAKAIIGVDHAIHIASVIPHDTDDDYEKSYFRPAKDMTINVLTAARDTPSVKRVVITSSISAYVPLMDYMSGNLPQVFKPDDENCHYDVKAPFNHNILAYAASKAMQLDAAQEFLDKEKPHFGTVIILPSVVIGKDYQATKSEDYFKGTPAQVIKLLLGEPGDPFLGSTVGLHDIAKLHVQGLKSSVPAGRYNAASDGLEGMKWNDAFAIVKKYFPEASEKLFAKEGDKATVKIQVDASKTEKAYGFTFQSFEEQVKEVVSAYLDLLKKEGKY